MFCCYIFIWQYFPYCHGVIANQMRGEGFQLSPVDVECAAMKRLSINVFIHEVGTSPDQCFLVISYHVSLWYVVAFSLSRFPIKPLRFIFKVFQLWSFQHARSILHPLFMAVMLCQQCIFCVNMKRGRTRIFVKTIATTCPLNQISDVSFCCWSEVDLSFVLREAAVCFTNVI